MLIVEAVDLKKTIYSFISSTAYTSKDTFQQVSEYLRFT